MQNAPMNKLWNQFLTVSWTSKFSTFGIVDTADIVHTVDTLDVVKNVNSVDNVSSVNSVEAAAVVVLAESVAWLGSAGSLAVPCLGSVCLALTSSKSNKALDTTAAAAQPPPAAEGGCCCCVQGFVALGAGQGKADRAEARHSKRASRAKAE